MGGSGGALGELWEAQGQLWEALAEHREALGELWMYSVLTVQCAHCTVCSLYSVHTVQCALRKIFLHSYTV